MKCLFPRKTDVSTSEGYNTSEVAREYNVLSSSKFKTTISMFDSTSYATQLSYPIQVTLNELIYVGVSKDNPQDDIKLVVQDCYATASGRIDDSLSYLFNKDKCPLDATFQIKSITKGSFNFVINAFRFIQISKSVDICSRSFLNFSASPGCTTRTTHRRCRIH